MHLYIPRKNAPFYSTILLLAALGGTVFSGLVSVGPSVASADTATRQVVDQEARADAVVRLTATVEFLCSKKLAGRAFQKNGLTQAAEFIEAELNRLGLETEYTNAATDQSFSIREQTSLTEGNRLTLTTPDRADFELRPPVVSENENDNQFPMRSGGKIRRQLDDASDFTPLSPTASGEFDLPLLFLGYGITIPKHEYSDYDEIDAKGKLVIVFRGAPAFITSDQTVRSAAAMERKIALARDHGAAGILFCDPTPSGASIFSPDVAKGKSIPLPPLSHSETANDYYVGYLRRDTVVKLLDATGHNLDTLEKRINENREPESCALAGCRAKGNFAVERKGQTERNVVAVLKGTGPHADETVIIGAHYDHLGLRTDPKDSEKTVMYPGADDNASGVAVILETARRLVERKEPLDRTIVFIAFTCEERGMRGSRHYCEHPVRPLERTVAMLNLDMVGRLLEGRLTLNGTNTGDRWDEFFAAANRSGELNLVNNPKQVGMSDHSSFVKNSISAIHVFTGYHSDYHKPTDTVNKINFEGMAKIADYMAWLLIELADADRPLKFREVETLQARQPQDQETTKPATDVNRYRLQSCNLSFGPLTCPISSCAGGKP